jgi:hypothetical protein
MPHPNKADSDKVIKIKFRIDHNDEGMRDVVEETTYWKRGKQANLPHSFGVHCWSALRRMFESDEQLKECVDTIIAGQEQYEAEQATEIESILQEVLNEERARNESQTDSPAG